jgi:hypothetical protein
MRLKDIKIGEWYDTKAGTGVCEQVGGVHPPAVKIRITWPIPFGTRWVAPRDVERQLTAGEVDTLRGRAF